MRILSDFDGTAAATDVGNLLFRTFADAEKCRAVVQQWKDGKLSSKACLIEECALARVTRAELERFVDAQKLDPHFPAFVAFCEKHNIPVEIVSDGFDFYIARILRNHGLDGQIPVRANRLLFVDSNRIEPAFPYYEQGCGVCANCKGVHVRRARQEHETVVYVGDGLSDRCGAREADVVFAKRGRDLLRFCRATGLPHHEYDTFADVLREIRRLLKT